MKCYRPLPSPPLVSLPFAEWRLSQSDSDPEEFCQPNSQNAEDSGGTENPPLFGIRLGILLVIWCCSNPKI